MKEMDIKGKVWTFGDDINTDLIFPNKYKHYVVDDIPKSALYAMVGVDPEFPTKISKGDIVAAGKNFGCGSSREYAPLSLKYAGISAVIAKSFGRIFFRNSVNIGLIPLICEEADKIKTGDQVSIHFADGEIVNETTGDKYKFKPLPDFLFKILECGGLIEFGKIQLKQTVEV